MSEETKTMHAELTDEAIEEATGGWDPNGGVWDPSEWGINLQTHTVVCPACQTTYSFTTDGQMRIPEPCPHCGYRWAVEPRQISVDQG